MIVVLALAQSTWTLVVGGDIMTNSVPVSNHPLRSLTPVVSTADLAIANLEIPLTNQNSKTQRKSAEAVRLKHQFILRGDPGHGAGIKAAGFDMVSLGNNHSMDYREPGLRQMIGVLDENKILHAGAGMNSKEAYAPAIYTMPDGKRVGLISALCFTAQRSLWVTTPATLKTPGNAVISSGGKVGAAVKKKVFDWTRRVKAQCDFLIVSLHWGIERTSVPQPFQVKLGRTFVDAGADVVLGHHPHVLQGAEVYKGKPIFYSMGNLLSPLPSDTGLAKLTFSGTDFQSADFYAARIGGGRTTLLAGKAAAAGPSRFTALCQMVSRKFPSRRSRPFTVP